MLGIGQYDRIDRRKVRTREDQILFNGKKYRRDKRSGYYVCTTGDRKRLHVAVWEDFWDYKVPEGCVIHHLDWDKSHNDIGNLICLMTWEHERVHNTPGGKEWGYEQVITRVNGLPADEYEKLKNSNK